MMWNASCSVPTAIKCTAHRCVSSISKAHLTDRGSTTIISCEGYWAYLRGAAQATCSWLLKFGASKKIYAICIVAWCSALKNLIAPCSIIWRLVMPLQCRVWEVIGIICCICLGSPDLLFLNYTYVGPCCCPQQWEIHLSIIQHF